MSVGSTPLDAQSLSRVTRHGVGETTLDGKRSRSSESCWRDGHRTTCRRGKVAKSGQSMTLCDPVTPGVAA